MATWQFSANLIPRSWAIENKYSSSLLYTEEGYDTEEAWKENQPKPEFIDILSNMLPPAESWSKDLLCWGNEEEHDIQVGYENKLIEGIHIRLDLNQKLSGIIVKLIKVAKELDCVLFFPELRTVTEASEFELKNALQKSRAAKIVKDPHRFIDELQK
ncbi:MAG: hypothetical protein COB30_019630 [Ectothiorhodospiraceae bacterium]|nr:hypothetical protein [Ectothiorhodospiraceae bacterium]